MTSTIRIARACNTSALKDDEGSLLYNARPALAFAHVLYPLGPLRSLSQLFQLMIADCLRIALRLGYSRPASSKATLLLFRAVRRPATDLDAAFSPRERSTLSQIRRWG